MSSLSLHHLTIGYGASPVQTDLQLTACAGQMICLLGQNGCGKSTLLRTLSGLLPALSGDAYIDDRNLLTMSEKDRSKQMAVVLTDRLSADHTTVHDVVAMGRYPYSSFLGGLCAEDEDVINRALAMTEMINKRDCFFRQLSDGEKQRCLISKALAQQTPCILLDEPTAHLDLPNRIKTLLLLRNLAHDTGRTILISTHELDLALQTADTIWLMMPSQGIKVGTPAELIQSELFQHAFADEHFRFVSEKGRLRIQIL